MPLASQDCGTEPAVRLELVQAAKGYKPGDSVHALLHIHDDSAAIGQLGTRGPQRPSQYPSRGWLHSNGTQTTQEEDSRKDGVGDLPEGFSLQGRRSERVQLEDISIKFKGIQRIDTSWVSKHYRRDVKPLNADTRRVQRPVIEASLQASTARDFGDDECRVYLIRFRLPEWLPPTFHGLAVRYTYYLDVCVRWTYGEGGSVHVHAGQAGGSPMFESHIRDVVHVWPLRGQKSQSDMMDEFVGRGGGGSQWASGEVPKVKCWEVGFGTSIDDAIENVELLRQDSANSVPYSPAYLSNSLSRTGSLEPDGGGRTGTGAGLGQSQSQEPSALLTRKLFQAAQDAILAEQKNTRLRIVTEESALVVDSRSKSTPKTPIADAPNGPTRYWDGSSGSTSSFRLRVRDTVFVTIHLHKASMSFEEDEVSALAPGSSLVGTLEFTNTDRVRCVKYMVSLEMEETVAEAWRWKGRGYLLSTLVEERTSLSPDTLASCVYFTLPSDATPSFDSDVVTLTWGLRFEFFFVPTGGGGAEKVEWKIPIKF